MTKHRFVCDSDGTVVTSKSAKQKRTCPECDGVMRWDLSTIGIADGDYNHTSDSLAIHPDDIVEHHRLYPGIEVTAEGQPQFTSVKQQETYALKSAGCYKKRQRIKSQRKRIA